MDSGIINISGNTTKRMSGVYVLLSIPRVLSDSKKKYLYVGKVGDNRKGRNPVISRIDNHFSFNRIHSQSRNKLKGGGILITKCIAFIFINM
jgi:hypothetical protein